ncbi:NAD-binding lipoprotein [Streptomyces sp. NPDC059582]|uniref:CASTOR/POLLUX-related putative ion channel n=1 Tax=Streptomyces sp. NPDC059582 TaxID=3346875 RepID=UPI0036B87C78
MAGRQRLTSWGDRARYLFDSTLARSTGALLGWLTVCCLAIVVPVSALLVWTDPDAPRSLSGRLTVVWRTSAETLRLGGVTGAPLRMLLSVLLGAIALLCVSTLVGVITTGLGDRLTELRRGRSTVLERDHAVVLGWSDQVFTVVCELIAARAGRGRGVVAVLADRDTAEMEEALRASLSVTGRARLVCRTGAPTDPRALALVAPTTAGSVLVLPTDDADADLQVLRVLLALRTLVAPHAAPTVVAAVRDARYLPTARLAAGPRGTVLETDLTTARLLVQAARRPGLPAALRDLLDFAGAEFHVRDAADLAGLTFKEVVLRFEESCVVGLLSADGLPLLTPGAETVLGPTDRLVVVAHDDTVPPPVDCRKHVDPAVVTAPGPRPDRPSRMLLLGWNRRAPMVVETLRRSVRPGSVLDVLPGAGAGAGAGCAPTPSVGLPDPGPLDVVWHAGDPVRPEALRALDLFGYDSVIVLGPDAGAGPELPDDRALLTLLVLRSLEEEAGRPLPVLAELCDHRSRALAPLGPAADAVVRGELTGLLMAQISHHPALAAVFEEIFVARGGALALRPAADYVLPGSETSFATVVAAALERGQCAIGYRAHGPDTARRGDGFRLCPRKAERRVWSAEDEVLVLTPTPDGRDVPGGQDSGLPGMRREHEGGGSPTGVPLG